MTRRCPTPEFPLPAVHRLRHVRRSGMVLIIVAIVMALVSLAAMGFLISMKTEDRSAHLQADQARVQQVAASGVEFLRALARMTREERLAWGPLQDNTTLFRDIRVDADPIGQRHGRFCVARAPLSRRFVRSPNTTSASKIQVPSCHCGPSCNGSNWNPGVAGWR